MATNDTGTSVDSYNLFYMYLGFYIVLTYGEIIDFFQEVCHSDSINAGCIDSSTLYLNFQTKYPHIPVIVSRPDRLLNSIRRIVAPTQPSLRGPSKLVGLSLEAYRNQIWAPRVTNPAGSSKGMRDCLQHLLIFVAVYDVTIVITNDYFV